jgi:hypothetical protein
LRREATGLDEDLDTAGLEDLSNGRGQDSEEEEDEDEEEGHKEGEEGLDEREEGHEDGEELYDEGLGVMGLLHDLHPHIDLGLATLFTLL